MAARFRSGMHVTDSLVVRELLGEGAWGEVWSAEDISLGVTYAIKRLHAPVLDANDALLAEIEAWIGLPASPYLCQCYFWATGPAREIIVVIELAPGGSLRARLENGDLATTENLIRATIQIADGLTLVHEAGIVHGDISPGNILTDEQGQFKLTDFGLATGMASSSGGEHRGTALYRGPEVVERRPRTSRTDLWSLGLLLIEMWLGYSFWSTGLAAKQIVKAAHGQVPRWPRSSSCRHRLLTLAAACFDARQSPTARELGKALRNLHEDQCGVSFPVAAPPSPTAAEKRALRSLNEVHYQDAQQMYDRAVARFGPLAGVPRSEDSLVPQRRSSAIADARYFARLAAFYGERLSETCAAEYLSILSQQALALEVAGNLRAAAFAFHHLGLETKRLDPSGTKYPATRAWALGEFANIRLIKARQPAFCLRLYDRAIAWAKRADELYPDSNSRELPHFLIQKATACATLNLPKEAHEIFGQAIRLLASEGNNAPPAIRHRSAYCHLWLAKCCESGSQDQQANFELAVQIWQELVDQGYENYAPSLVHAKFESLRSIPSQTITATVRLAAIELLEPLARAIVIHHAGNEIAPTLPRLLFHKARCLSLLDRDQEASAVATEALGLYETALIKTGALDLRQEYGNACTWLAMLYASDDFGAHDLLAAVRVARQAIKVWTFLNKWRENPGFFGRIVTSRMTLAYALANSLPISPEAAHQFKMAEHELARYEKLGQPPLPSSVTSMRDGVRQIIAQSTDSEVRSMAASTPAQRSSKLQLPAGYRSIRKLPSNPQMRVCVAQEAATGNKVVVKCLTSDWPVTNTIQLRFEREISVLRQIHHPRLVQVLNAGCDPFGSWFVMEYLPAGDLHRWVTSRRTPVTPAKALAIVDQILEALAFLHHLPQPLDPPPVGQELRTIVHRDVKPLNILLVDRQATAVKLADFGFAKAHELAGYSGITASKVCGGTCWFAARSLAGQFRDAPPAADVWSTAATLFFLLTGQPPRLFDPGCDEWQVVLRCKARSLRKLRPDVPAKLAKVIDEALLERPSRQLCTANGLRTELSAAAEASGIKLDWLS